MYTDIGDTLAQLVTRVNRFDSDLIEVNVNFFVFIFCISYLFHDSQIKGNFNVR